MTAHYAQIVEDYGRRYVIRLANQQRLDAVTRRKNLDYACGDMVQIQILNQQQAVIESVQTRSSLLFRQDAYRTKLIAANVNQIWIVLAAAPAPNELLLQRTLLAAEVAGIQAALLINKIDLLQSENWRLTWQAFEKMGYLLHAISATENQGLASLRAHMHGKNNILIGQSGMGKSTIINTLLNKEVARVGEFSQALDSGRHTTTHTRLYDLDEKSSLIDSPGLQNFGLNHLQAADLLHYLPDMRHLIGQCRFHNCTHRQEPNCAIKQAVEAGDVSASRLLFLQNMNNELRH